MLPSSLESDLKNIIKQAGDLLVNFWHRWDSKSSSYSQASKKKNGQGLVTEADLKTEQFLISALGDLLPDANFWAEESGKSGSPSDYTWVIDPLDGTRNFAHHLPYFCISIALTYHDEPIIGVIYNPLADELIYAQKGTGAFCNDMKLGIAPPEAFADSFIAVGIPYARSQRQSIMAAIDHLAGRVAAMRHMGAVALDMANLAMGRFDGVIFTHLSWWDVAAAVAIIKESGGTIADMQGNSLTPNYQGCIAGSPLVFDAVYELFKKSTEI